MNQSWRGSGPAAALCSSSPMVCTRSPSWAHRKCVDTCQELRAHCQRTRAAGIPTTIWGCGTRASGGAHRTAACAAASGLWARRLLALLAGDVRARRRRGSQRVPPLLPPAPFTQPIAYGGAVCRQAKLRLGPGEARPCARSEGRPSRAPAAMRWSTWRQARDPSRPPPKPRPKRLALFRPQGLQVLQGVLFFC